jgi:hypothetical protein
MRVVSRFAPVLLAVGAGLVGCAPPSHPGSASGPAGSPAAAADKLGPNQVLLEVADMH